MKIIPPILHDGQAGEATVVFDINLCDAIIGVGLTTFAITFCIFFALHSPGELQVEDGFRQLPTISLTGIRTTPCKYMRPDNNPSYKYCVK
jgi:hypothetical protein